MATLFPYQTGTQKRVDKSPEALARNEAFFNSPEQRYLRSAFESGPSSSSSNPSTMSFYDTTTWKPYDDQSQYQNISSAQWDGPGYDNYIGKNDGQGSFVRAENVGYGDPYKDYLKSRFDVSPLTQGWLGGLDGMTPDKAEAGIQEYFRKNGQGWDDWRFWGDDARLRAVGTGLDALNPDAAWKGSWQPLWNQQRELAGQKDIAQDYETNEKAMGSDMGDVMSMIPGILSVLTAGAAAGAFSGVGLSGLSAAEASSLAGSYGLGGEAASGLLAAAGGGAGASALDPSSWAGFDASLGSGADAAWGVNPQGGANMFDLDIGGIDDLISGWDAAPTDLYPDVGLPDVGGPPGGPGPAADPLAGWTEAELRQLADFGIQGANPGPSGDILSQIRTLMNQLPPGSSQALRAVLNGGGAGASRVGSALSRIAGGTGGASDWLSLLGTLGTGALSYASADKYADSMKEIADRSWNAGADYRNRLASTYTNPGAYLDSPEVQAILNRSQGAMGRALSARDGNPVGSGRALTEMNDYAAQTLLGQLGNYRQQLANFGGQSQLTGNYNALATGAAGAGSNVYNSLARTANQVFNPQPELNDYLRMLGGSNGLA